MHYAVGLILLSKELHDKHTHVIGTRGGTRNSSQAQAPAQSVFWQEITGSTDSPPSPLPFTRPTRPATPLPPDSAPIEFYEKLVNDRVIQIIVDETNRFA